MKQGGLHVLMSQHAIDKHGAQIEAIAGVGKIHWLTLESQPDANGSYPTDISFVTRDITGASTKTKVLPPLARYYQILRASPALQWVHAHSAGADRPIYPELLARGVRVTTSSGANAAPVAHTAVAAVLALGRQFPVQIAAQHQRKYVPMTTHPLLHDITGQTAMVVGLGAIGVRIAEYLQALGLQVIGVTHDPAKHIGAKPASGTGAAGASSYPICSYAQMDAHLPHIDYVVLACPLTATTARLLDAARLAQVRRGCYLVNVARGEVCVEQDVIQALQSGQLGGAFLDGFEVEPLSDDSPLWDLPNVMLSAHTAGHFTGHADNVAKIFIDNVARCVQGSALRNELRIST
jgi:phosphoglycerate dehydrogenase-like enzyme